MNKRYRFEGHNGESYCLTAKKLCERIINDSESDYNWIAPARELVRVVREPDFPYEYALVIKVAILNCFANIERRANRGGDRHRRDERDQQAVEYCYNSMYDSDETMAILARRSFLVEFVTAASDVGTFSPFHHTGPTYIKLCADWRFDKVKEYISKRDIDFAELEQVLRKSFAVTIKMAEAEGAFVEDEKQAREEMNKFWQSIDHKNM